MPATLVLADMGRTLAAHLREADAAASYLPFDDQRMGEIIAAAMASVPVSAREEVGRSVQRLGFLQWLTRPLGRRAAALGKAVAGLRRAVAGGG